MPDEESAQIEASALRELAPWAASLREEDLALACSGMRRRHYPQGRSICVAGEVFDQWVGVSQGLIKLRRLSSDGKETVGPGVHAGGWFGEGSLIKSEPRGYDAIALRDTSVMLMDQRTFLRLFERSAAFGQFLVCQLNERLTQFMDMAAHDRGLDATARVARGLASLFNTTLYPHVGRDLDITQEEVGLLAGVSRPVANQALKALHSEGLVTVGYGGIVVHDIERLRAYG